MDLELSDEQRLLGETLDRLLADRYDANARLALLDSPTGWSRELWQQYAQLGLLGLGFEETYGGAGTGVSELAVVMEAFGRALVLEPYFPTVVLGGGLVSAAGTAEQKAALLPAIAGGDVLVAFAHTEPASRWSLRELATTATPDGRDWLLSGQKIAVTGGDSADQLVVSSRTPDGTTALFLLDATSVRRDTYPMQDGQRGADILLASTPAVALGEPEDALPALESVLDLATAALCAEAVGAMERMVWLTVAYLKERVQFGRPLAEFQALQHRAADMYVSLDQARSMALLARLALAGGSGERQRTMVRAAKLQIDLAARHVGQEAVQLHGGIGMTMEYPVGHYLKRTGVIAKTFADVDRLIELVGADGGPFAEPAR